MKRISLLIALICCVGASAGWLLDSNAVDFIGLDHWLFEQMGPANVQEMVAFMNGNFDKIKSSKKSRAAAVVLKVVEADKCDEQMFPYLKMIKDSGMNLRHNIKRNYGSSKAMMLSRFGDVNKLCVSSIEQEAANIYEHSLANNVKELIEKALPQTKSSSDETKFRHYVSNVRYAGYNPSLADWAHLLQSLSKDDDKAKVGGAHQRKNFDYAFNKYLEQPCKVVTELARDTMNLLYVLADLQCEADFHYSLYIYKVSETVQRLSYGYKICSSLQGLKKKEIDQIYKESLVQQ